MNQPNPIGNVIGIRGGPLPPEAKQPRETTISILETALAAARTGDLQSVFMVPCTSEGYAFDVSDFTTLQQLQATIGAVEFAKSKMFVALAAAMEALERGK